MPETAFSEPNNDMADKLRNGSMRTVFCFSGMREESMREVLKMKMRTILCVISVLIFVLPLTGCMKDKDLEEYRELMDQFFVSAAEYDDRINSIDPEAEDASKTFLTEIDGLNSLVTAMADYKVPHQFSACEALADEAAENMNAATEYWHQAYGDDGSFNEQMSDTAEQYYERANRRISAILEILHGNIPEDATVIEQEAVIGTVAVPEEETGTSNGSPESVVTPEEGAETLAGEDLPAEG